MDYLDHRNGACAHREAAGVARWLLENREGLLQQSTLTLEVSVQDELPALATIKGPKKGSIACWAGRQNLARRNDLCVS